MSLILVSTSGKEPITTGEAKLHLRVDGDTEDSYIASLISEAREYCEKQTERTIVTRAYKLTLPGFPESGITLPKPPLQSITSIKYTSPQGQVQTLTDYQFASREPARIVPAYTRPWPATREIAEAVTVEFTNGYGAESTGPCPLTIKRAMLLLIGHWYAQREGVSDKPMSPVPMAVESLLTSNSWGNYQ